MTPRVTKSAKFLRELEEMQEAINTFQKRVEFIQSQGVDVEQVNTAISDLSTNVDALIASKAPAGGITPAEAQTIVDGLTAISTKIKAAITPA